jgi:RNA polymerase-binding transcription factor DksA
MTMTIKTAVSARKAAFFAQKTGLEARLAAIETEIGSHQDPDWEEMAVERETDEVLEATGLTTQHDLRQIEAALHRIDIGDYGRCVKCGTTIEDARLDVLPATPFCRACAT